MMGSTGESVRKVSDFGFNPTWSPDGKKLAVSSVGFAFPQDRAAYGGLFIVDVSSGERTQLTPTNEDAVQPKWSPHGNRIAYWGLRANSGRRDIWTIAADGSESKTGSVTVTDDAALDWSPAWSPDGNYLYFSSNRGGTLNLWRVPIEETTGKIHGDFEPVTVPSGWSGSPSFSRDGKLAFASLEWRSRLLRLPFDPVAGKVTGSPIQILASSYPIRDHAVSPDGNWIAYNAFAGGNEDLFLVRMDGTGLRRLTDDPDRDRGPNWRPDGALIAFYSDRSGEYEIWTIRPDGSGLEQLTKHGGTTNLPTFSPDGKQIAATDIAKGWGIMKVTNPPLPASTLMPEADSVSRFWPFSWSSDGSFLLGTMLDMKGRLHGLAVFSVKDSRFQILPETKLMGLFASSTWLSDTHRFLYRDRRGISLYDINTQSAQMLYPVGGYFIARSMGVTSDNRNITFTETATEGDIWLVEFDKKGQ